jgi:hypothetical protein
LGECQILDSQMPTNALLNCLNTTFAAGVDDCCASDDRLVCLSIPIPEDDPFFAQYDKTCQSLTRTQTALMGDCDPNGPKQQVPDL